MAPEAEETGAQLEKRTQKEGKYWWQSRGLIIMLSVASPKKDVLLIIGDWNVKVGRQEIPGVTGIWPWSTE